MVEFEPKPGANYKHDYLAIFREVAAGRLKKLETYRELCRNDLFFLLHFGLERTDVNHPWIVERIREAERNRADTLDLWAREHYKSTIRTYAQPLQDLIRNPEERIAIFSHTRPIAKGFLRQIKQTLESDVPLKRWFPDVFYRDPKKQAPKWSEDDGIMVKRRSTAKEASIEAWGLVDGQPTSKHFTIRIYDDVVTKESVTTPEQIKKTLEAYELSHSLGTDGGIKRVVGTHYHFADLYMTLRKKPGYKVSVHPATHDGKETGTPVLLSRERLNELRREQGVYVFSCQQLLNPVADENQTFRLEWLNYYGRLPSPLNKYLLVDPANEKKETSDYTVMAVIGVSASEDYFLVDMVRDRLNLTERWYALRNLWLEHRPLRVGYEKYGKDADISYMKEKQRKESIYFAITPLGGQMKKEDRIRRLVPLFEEGRFWLPERMVKDSRDLIKEFVEEEYVPFPYCVHDDMLDCIARIMEADMAVCAPVAAGAIHGTAETEYDVLRY